MVLQACGVEHEEHGRAWPPQDSCKIHHPPYPLSSTSLIFHIHFLHQSHPLQPFVSPPHPCKPVLTPMHMAASIFIPPSFVLTELITIPTIFHSFPHHTHHIKPILHSSHPPYPLIAHDFVVY